MNLTMFEPGRRPVAPVMAKVALASAVLALAVTAVEPAGRSITVELLETSVPLMVQVPASVLMFAFELRWVTTTVTAKVFLVVPSAAVTSTAILFEPGRRAVGRAEPVAKATVASLLAGLATNGIFEAPTGSTIGVTSSPSTSDDKTSDVPTNRLPRLALFERAATFKV